MRQIFINQINNLENFNQEEKEAAVKLLLLVMYADGVIDENETSYIDQLLLNSSWQSNTSIDDFIADIKPALLEAINGGDALQSFIDACKNNISSAEKQHSIYTICAKMANSDNHVHDNELHILKSLMGAFGQD